MLQRNYGKTANLFRRSFQLISMDEASNQISARTHSNTIADKANKPKTNPHQGRCRITQITAIAAGTKKVIRGKRNIRTTSQNPGYRLGNVNSLSRKISCLRIKKRNIYLDASENNCEFKCVNKLFIKVVSEIQILKIED